MENMETDEENRAFMHGGIRRRWLSPKRFWKKVFSKKFLVSAGTFVIGILIGILVIIAFNTIFCKDEHSLDKDTMFKPPHYGPDYEINATHYLEILEELIKIRTISYGDERDEDNRLAFAEVPKLLNDKFPHIHKSNFTNITVINGSLCYVIQGSMPEKKPYMIIAHMDVVPAENEKEWTKHPFGEDDSFEPDPDKMEKDADKYLYGRGTLDVKSVIVGTFAGLEVLTHHSWRPERTIYIFIGHDEEIGGYGGARIAAEMLKKENITLEFILDEGAAATRNHFPGIGDRIVGLIGVVEKGYLSVDIESSAEAGHSSMPGEDSSIGNLAKAIVKISENPFPKHLDEGDLTRETLEWIAPYTTWLYRAALSNMWITKPFVLYYLTEPQLQATLKTTTSFTIIKGGSKENVLPSKSFATINHRLHPRETIQEVLQRDANILRHLENVEVKERSGWQNDAPPISPHGPDARAYHAIKSSINNVFEGSIVLPYITVAGTDSKHFVGLTQNIYRFAPYILDKNHDDTTRIHGINERINREEFEPFIRFYINLIKTADNI